MKTLKNPAVLLTFLIVFGGIFVYKNFIANPSVDNVLTTSDITTVGPGKTVVDLYNRLQAVSLDTTILNQASYRALTDFSAPLALQPVGRTNPFDKLP